jgi:hypothetical protein
MGCLQIAPGLPGNAILNDIVSLGGAQRHRLVLRARRLTQLALGWHVLEATVAVAAGVVAGSVALVGFGADSLIEAAAGLVVLWLVTDERLASHHAERRAQQLIAVSFGLLAAYVTLEAIRDLIGSHHPAVSWVGIGLSVVTLLAMPPLAHAKRRADSAPGSSATELEARGATIATVPSAAGPAVAVARTASCSVESMAATCSTSSGGPDVPSSALRPPFPLDVSISYE